MYLQCKQNLYLDCNQSGAPCILTWFFFSCSCFKYKYICFICLQCLVDLLHPGDHCGICTTSVNLTNGNLYLSADVTGSAAIKMKVKPTLISNLPQHLFLAYCKTKLNFANLFSRFDCSSTFLFAPTSLW